MDIQQREMLEKAGVEVEKSLHRLLDNEELYRRFLIRFLEDDTFQRIGAARNAADPREMEMAAHTLKGVAGNLGMAPLYVCCREMVEKLREGDMAGALEAHDRLIIAYADLCPALENLREGGDA